MNKAMLSMHCRVCGTTSALERTPYRCPSAGDGREHSLQAPASDDFGDTGELNPFLAFRSRSLFYRYARSKGMSDQSYVSLVRQLDDEVAQIDGVGFRRTPFLEQPELGSNVFVKDETGNVTGSHKGRHLMGLALYLKIELGEERPRLAIASCGNAALAATTVAKACAYPIEVMVPAWASEEIQEKLRSLGANLRICPRRSGESGDPCMLRFRQAVADGAVPFSCQGSENSLTIEGGKTLGYELAERSLQHLFLQVGGGALASGVIQGLEEAVSQGQLAKLPVIHAVQVHACSPLTRAYRLIQERGVTVDYARNHRCEFMWPWDVGESAASGLLDDETYDWAEVLEGVMASGGSVITVSEEMVNQANTLALRTGVPVCPTGSSGVAGWLSLNGPTAGERVGLVFSGRQR